MNKKSRNIVIAIVIIGICILLFLFFFSEPAQNKQTKNHNTSDAKEENKTSNDDTTQNNGSDSLFSGYKLFSAEFDSKNGEYVKLLCYYELIYYDSAVYAYITDRDFNLSYNEIWNTYLDPVASMSLPSPENIDLGLFLNYIYDLKISTAVVNNPSSEELEKYGLAEPLTVTAFEFSTGNSISGESSISNTYFVAEESIDTIFEIRIGKPASAAQDAYYALVTCKKSADDKSNKLKTPAIYTLDASCANYFIDMSANSFNGINSGIVLADEALPSLTPDTFDSVDIFEYEYENVIYEGSNDGHASYTAYMTYEKDMSVSYDSSGMLSITYVTYGDMISSQYETKSITTSAAKQFFDFISKDNQFKYSETVYEGISRDDRENILVQYGLLYPVKIYIFTYKQSSSYTDNWSIMIGKSGEEYYVTASNSNNIYKMSDNMINYLLTLDEKILSGEKVYEEK